MKKLKNWWKQHNCKHSWNHLKTLKVYKWGKISYKSINTHYTFECPVCNKITIVKY